MVPIYYDPVFLEHDTGLHPECRERVESTLAYLGGRGGGLAAAIRSAPRAGDDALSSVHAPSLFRGVEAAAARGGTMLDPDTVCSPRSPEAARAAAGAVAAAASDALRGGAPRAFCLVRPPGHHACPDRAMGFCLFNNVAVAARAALALPGGAAARRVAVVDFDVHHGNGTQEAFYEDPQVFFLSLHRYPFYPGTGAADERGAGPGLGTTRNVPLPHHTRRERYLEAFREALREVERFAPDLLLCSAGFDAWKGDPVGGLNLEVGDFHEIGRELRALAERVSGGRLVAALEGGYDLDALPRCIEAFLTAIE